VVGVDVVREAHRVEAKVDRLLHSKPVPITISVGGHHVIRQTGVGGLTDSATGEVSIEVAATSPLPRHRVLTV
jgi:hypothetical protein